MRIGWILCGMAILTGFLLCRSSMNLPGSREGTVSLQPFTWRDTIPAGTAVSWDVFVGTTGAIPAGAGPLGARFRLAGTFFEHNEGTGDKRKAVLDDLKEGTQRIVAENDEISDVRVVRIFLDKVVLRCGSTEEQLWLNFSCQTGREGAAMSTSSTQNVSVAGADDAGIGKFGGKRVGEQRWVFKRQSLLNYYQELRDDPERLLKLFDTFKPVRDANQRITGYVIGIEGEADFIGSTGLKQGDIVRGVNERPMTNRRRAEWFISEFVQDRANAFVFEIERNGQSQKLVYQVR